MRAATSLLVLASACSFTRTDGVAPPPPSDTDAPPLVTDGPPPPDAESFSPEKCPSTYDHMIQGHPGSRYRFIATLAPFAEHHAACNADRPGWTHLVVIDDVAEATAVGRIDTSDYEYIGAVQTPRQTDPALGWRLFTGGTPTTGWSPVESQPDDGDHSEDGEESLAVVASTGNMHDVTGQQPHAAACECDGLAIDPEVAAMIP